MTMKFLLFLIVMMIPMSSAFADSGCWYCPFVEWASTPTEKREMTIEELYVQEAEKGRQSGLQAIKEQISDLKKQKNQFSTLERNSDADYSYLKNGLQKDIDFYQGLLDGEKDRKENPAKYYTQRDLAQLALEYYKYKPDGTQCTEGTHWVDKKQDCYPTGRAESRYMSYDLEWLRYYKFDTSLREIPKQNSESNIICGKGTIDIDGICQVDKSKIKVKQNHKGGFNWIFDLIT